MTDVRWRQAPAAHPLVGQVLKAERPIAIDGDQCVRSPLQQLIVEVWDTIRAGGVVLLGEVHDNPAHHLVRGDILRPRLEQIVATRGLHPAAVFEHIHTGQQAQLDSFHKHSAESRRMWTAQDLLRELDWNSTGWPPAEIFYPLFGAALSAKLPVYPGNPTRQRRRDVVRGAPDQTDEEAARLKLAGTMPEPLVEALKIELRRSHCDALPESALAPMSLMQRYTDAHLAGAAIEAAHSHGGAFLLTGNGHVRTDRGVPWYVRRLAPELKVTAVMLLEVEEGKTSADAYLPRSSDGAPAADYVLFTPRHQRPDPCEKMRRDRR